MRYRCGRCCGGSVFPLRCSANRQIGRAGDQSADRRCARRQGSRYPPRSISYHFIGGPGMIYQNLLYAVADRVATITLNRPERHNALSIALMNEIMAAVVAADEDPAVRVIIVTGAGGKAFSTGYDLKESEGKPKRTIADWRARMQKDIRFTYAVWDCSKPVIASIDGFCLAGALEFAMCCDMRLCSDIS